MRRIVVFFTHLYPECKYLSTFSLMLACVKAFEQQETPCRPTYLTASASDITPSEVTDMAMPLLETV